MARDNTISISGNLTRSPELKYLPGNGTPVCSFGLAWNPPGKRQADGSYENADPHFFDVTCWSELAEHVAETMDKGMRVNITGNLEYRSWETGEGEKRTKVEIRADEVGPSLRWATADVTRTEKGGGSNPAPKRQAKSQQEQDEEPF